jgi:hypothetical protein
VVVSLSELPEGIHSDVGGCSVGAGSAAIGSTAGIAIGSGADAGFFFGPAFFFVIRFAFFFAPFLAFRLFAKQLHRPIVEVRLVIKLLGIF